MRALEPTFVLPATLILLLFGCNHEYPLEPPGSTARDHPPAASRAPLPAPASATAVASEDEVLVAWKDMSSNETRFEVHRAATPQGVFSLLATAPANVVTYADREVGLFSQYCYRVRAVRVMSSSKIVYSSFSNTACATPVLAAPSALTVAATSETQVDLAWQENSRYETGLEVHRAPFAGGTYTLRATLAAQTTTYSDQGLEPGTQYCYKVRAFRASGGGTSHSVFAGPTCGTTLVPAPAAPTGVAAKPHNSSNIYLSWIDNSTQEAFFRIESSTDGGAVWSVWGTTYANATWTDRLPAVAEQQVCYRVVAVNPAGEAASNPACTVPPRGPGNLMVTGVDANTIAATWNDNSGVEDGYQLRVWETNCIGPACDAFDPWCENYGICEQTRVVATLPANSTAYKGPGVVSMGHSYTVFYVVATRDGGNSDASDPRVPLYPLE